MAVANDDTLTKVSTDGIPTLSPTLKERMANADINSSCHRPRPILLPSPQQESRRHRLILRSQPVYDSLQRQPRCGWRGRTRHFREPDARRTLRSPVLRLPDHQPRVPHRHGCWRQTTRSDGSQGYVSAGHC